MTEDTEIRQPESEEAGQGAVETSSPASGSSSGDHEPGSVGAEHREGVEAEMEDLRAELASLNDQHLRLAAEFDNYRKRNQREREALATRLQADLVASLLDVLDDLQRVADSGAETASDSVLEGVRLVEKKFLAILEAAGLQAMDAEGQRFDPEIMEALMTVPTGDPDKDERVADVFQRGYQLGDTLVRPARVRVWQYDESEAND